MPLNPFELLARMWCANGSLGWQDKAWDVNQKQKKTGRKFTRNLYNKTLEHGPFIDYLPRTMAIFPGFVKLPEGNMWMDVLIKKRRNFTSKRWKFLDFDPAMVVWDLGPFGVFFNNRGCSPPLLELEALWGSKPSKVSIRNLSPDSCSSFPQYHPGLPFGNQTFDDLVPGLPCWHRFRYPYGIPVLLGTNCCAQIHMISISLVTSYDMPCFSRNISK